MSVSSSSLPPFGSSNHSSAFPSSVKANATKVDQLFWTHQQFDWHVRNPLHTVFKRGNEYVAQQWSIEFLQSCVDNLKLAKTSLKSAWEEIKEGHFMNGAKHLLNATLVFLKLGLNIQLGNFIKGVLGVFISTGKLLYHSAKFTVELVFVLLLMAIGKLGLFADPAYRSLFEAHVTEMRDALGFAAQDVMSLITSVGHAIPSWLPLVIMAVCPPAGVALCLVKNAAKFTGIFDLMGYGGTAVLLYAKAKVAQWRLGDQSLATEARQDAEKTRDAWLRLKSSFKPTRSGGDALLAGYAIHVVVTGVSTAIDCFVPGLGQVSEWVGDSGQAVAGLGLAAAVYRHHRQQQEIDLLPVDPGLSSTQATAGSTLIHDSSLEALDEEATVWGTPNSSFSSVGQEEASSVEEARSWRSPTSVAGSIGRWAATRFAFGLAF